MEISENKKGTNKTFVINQVIFQAIKPLIHFDLFSMSPFIHKISVYIFKT